MPWPDSGIASWEKCEILLKFYNLLKGKNYKVVWEATPWPALLVFRETRSKAFWAPRSLRDGTGAPGPALTPEGREDTVLGSCLVAHLGGAMATSDPVGRNTVPTSPSVDTRVPQPGFSRVPCQGPPPGWSWVDALAPWPRQRQEVGGGPVVPAAGHRSVVDRALSPAGTRTPVGPDPSSTW